MLKSGLKFLLKGLLKLMTNFFYLLRYFFKIKINRKIEAKSFVFLQRGVRIIVESEARIILGARVLLKENTVVYAKKGATISIGDNSSTGHNTEISANNLILIGCDVIMAAHTYICDANHGIEFKGVPFRLQPMSVGETRIGDNVWLGRNVMVLKGAVIKDNTILAAGAIASSKYDGNRILGGVPANVIRVSQE